jgi:hypothetical protein
MSKKNKVLRKPQEALDDFIYIVKSTEVLRKPSQELLRSFRDIFLSI